MPTTNHSLIANVSKLILSLNPSRLEYHVQNNDTTVEIFHGFDPQVAVAGSNRGTRLIPITGFLRNEHHKGEVWVIAAANAVNITVEETVSLDIGKSWPAEAVTG